MWRERGQKSAKFWASHPSVPHASGPHDFVWVWAPPCDPTMARTPDRLAQIGFAQIVLDWSKLDWPKKKNGQIKMAKTGLAKVGLFRLNRSRTCSGQFGLKGYWPEAVTTASLGWRGRGGREGEGLRIYQNQGRTRPFVEWSQRTSLCTSLRSSMIS